MSASAAPAGERLVAGILAGDRRALARALSVAERGGPEASALVAALHPHARGAVTIGVAGAPGAGKSTLTDRLVAALRSGGSRVAVLAVDPSSPFSRGAILGDRIRMQSHAVDEGVFIRSMASRGHLGGLALAAPQLVRVLDAAGFDPIVIETVGVGQVEVEIATHADTTVVVVNPGWGDAVQAAKAGLLEIADVFVVNKADRPGAEETVRDLELVVALAGDRPWRPPVVRTIATTGEGIDALVAALHAHAEHLDRSGEGRRRRRARVADELRSLALARVEVEIAARASGERFEALVDEVLAGTRDPWSAAGDLLP